MAWSSSIEAYRSLITGKASPYLDRTALIMIVDLALKQRLQLYINGDVVTKRLLLNIYA